MAEQSSEGGARADGRVPYNKIFIDCRATAAEVEIIQQIARETCSVAEKHGAVWIVLCGVEGRMTNVAAMRLAEELRGRAMLDHPDGVRIDVGRSRSVMMRVERGADRRGARDRGQGSLGLYGGR